MSWWQGPGWGESAAPPSPCAPWPVALRRPAVAQVLGMVQDAATLRALAWPQELRIVKTTSRSGASSFLAGKSCWHTRLKVQYTTADAQVGRRAAGAHARAGLAGVVGCGRLTRGAPHSRAHLVLPLTRCTRPTSPTAALL